jgi:hypothetical protein
MVTDTGITSGLKKITDPVIYTVLLIPLGITITNLIRIRPPNLTNNNKLLTIDIPKIKPNLRTIQHPRKLP